MDLINKADESSVTKNAVKDENYPLRQPEKPEFRPHELNVKKATGRRKPYWSSVVDFFFAHLKKETKNNRKTASALNVIVIKKIQQKRTKSSG